ncbi:MAG TPA: hypothetical protein VEZ90_10040, partial [Blastocatellia bacterium]|nr:hypothetical protein [Blastocatellia bacterium]
GEESKRLVVIAHQQSDRRKSLRHNERLSHGCTLPSSTQREPLMNRLITSNPLTRDNACYQ